MLGDPGIADQLRRLEEQLLQHETRSSPEALRALLAEDFIEFGSSGKAYTREGVIAALRSESGVRHSLDSFDTRFLAPGVALVTYRSTRLLEGEPNPQRSLRSSIWVMVRGRWQLVFHQGTPLENETRQHTP